MRRADGDGDGQFDTQQFDVYDGAHVVLRLDHQARPSRRMLYGPAVDQVLLGEVKLPEAMIKWEKTSCWVIPAGQNLRAIEDQLQNRERPQYILKGKKFVSYSSDKL